MRFSSKAGIELTILAVLNHHTSDRGLKLSEFATRCFRKGEVHEFLVANEWAGDRHMVFNDISYLGFMEFSRAGVVEVGDELLDEDGREIGEIIGFDYTHMPNHMNVVVSSASDRTGAQRGFSASGRFKIKGY